MPLRLTLALSLVLLAACGRHVPEEPDAGGDAGLPAIVDAASPHVGADGGMVPPYAQPRMGSGGYAYAAGNAWPGASVPAGMARVGPETTGPYQTINFLHFDGYWAGDTSILAFSHLHLHGTGAQDYGVLGVMPAAAFDPTELRVEDYVSAFDPTSEVATPGYYAVNLMGGTQVQLTATTHATDEVYRFPAGAASGTLIVDPNHRLAAANDAADDPQASLALLPDGQTLQGSLQTQGGMSGGFTLYFSMHFSRPWSAAHCWQQNAVEADGTSSVSGQDSGVGLDFDVSGGQEVEVEVGLSLVSLAGAEANLAAELPSGDFAAHEAAAVAAWNARLDVAQLHASPEQDAQVATFYSALHHAFVMPGIYSDDDGSYLYAGQTATASGFHFMTDLSLWDTYRTLDPLYDLLAPDIGLDVVQSLHAMAVLSTNFPKWPLATDDSGVMIGSSADVVVAHAYLNGVTGFDVGDAYQRLRDAALLANLPAGEGRGGRDDFTAYAQYGYAPAPQSGAVSLTCELNQDDFALAQWAQALGNTADAQTLLARAQGYQKLYDPSTGFLRWHDTQGNIPADSFDPSNFDLSQEYVEANAYQTQFCPQFDVAGMMQMWGGRAPFVAALQNLFAESQAEREADEQMAANPPPGSDPNLFAENLTPVYYFAGNEPDIHYAYLFAQAGRPDLTEQWVPWLRDHFYSSQPNGLPGNDDGGTMAAWYVWSCLGLYPVPGSDQYIIGSPLFPAVDLQVGGGTFTVTAKGVSAANIYVQSATLNGQPLTSAVIHRADLKAGGSLELVMGSSPSSWAQVTD